MRLETAIAKRLKKKIVEELGSGGNGTAYLLNDGTVMKVTGQSSEYYTSTSLIGKKLKYICQIYATYRIKFKDETYFAIIQEHLDTSIFNELENFERSTYAHGICRRMVKSGFNKENESVQKFNEKLKEYPQYAIYFAEYKKLVIASRRIGIKNSDMFSGNIGQRKKGGHFVLFDLGYSPSEVQIEGGMINLTPDYEKSKPKPLFFKWLRKKELGIALANIN